MVSERALHARTRGVRLLDLDADLGQALDPERMALARRDLIVPFARVPTSGWGREPDFGLRYGLGLLITEGLALRRVSLGGRSACEVLGPGDLLRPWDDDWHFAYPMSASFRVIDTLAIAALDDVATRRVMHFPEVVSQLMGRVMARSRRLIGHLTIVQFGSVDMRVHVALWLLAERFGRVRPDGVLLPVRLTHEALGNVIGARRPSVTVAIGRLTARGLIAPHPHGWLLHGRPPEVGSSTLAPSMSAARR